MHILFIYLLVYTYICGFLRDDFKKCKAIVVSNTFFALCSSLLHFLEYSRCACIEWINNVLWVLDVLFCIILFVYLFVSFGVDSIDLSSSYLWLMNHSILSLCYHVYILISSIKWADWASVELNFSSKTLTCH